MQTKLDPRSNGALAPEGYRLFHVVAGIFIASLLVSNTIAVKVISLGPFTLPAGILTFPVAYIFGDVLTEVYGYRQSRKIIWLGFFCLAGMSLFYWLATLMPPAVFWKDNDQAFSQFFGFVPRIVFSSFIAYLVGEFLNSVVLSKLKVRTQGRHFWFRALASTVAGEGVDSFIFNFLAFGGVFDIGTVAVIALSGFVLKCLYELIALPFTYLVVDRLKRIEGVDTFDYDADYSPFKLQ